MKLRMLAVCCLAYGGWSAAAAAQEQDVDFDEAYRGSSYAAVLSEPEVGFGDYFERESAAAPAFEPDNVSVQTCGKLLGAKQTALRLQAGGFSQSSALEETLNRPEWHNASPSETAWAMRIVDEAYAEPDIKTSQVVRECQARSQGMEAPVPVQLPES
ncbi:MAG TPA: hypothetical protein VJU83_01300 [Burkholderiales bacterium]|nr:hypothetical protein [Burkholderiales bacterium]